MDDYAFDDDYDEGYGCCTGGPLDTPLQHEEDGCFEQESDSHHEDARIAWAYLTSQDRSVEKGGQRQSENDSLTESTPSSETLAASSSGRTDASSSTLLSSEPSLNVSGSPQDTFDTSLDSHSPIELKDTALPSPRLPPLLFDEDETGIDWFEEAEKARNETTESSPDAVKPWYLESPPTIEKTVASQDAQSRKLEEVEVWMQNVDTSSARGRDKLVAVEKLLEALDTWLPSDPMFEFVTQLRTIVRLAYGFNVHPCHFGLPTISVRGRPTKGAAQGSRIPLLLSDFSLQGQLPMPEEKEGFSGATLDWDICINAERLSTAKARRWIIPADIKITFPGPVGDFHFDILNSLLWRHLYRRLSSNEQGSKGCLLELIPAFEVDCPMEALRQAYFKALLPPDSERTAATVELCSSHTGTTATLFTDRSRSMPQIFSRKGLNNVIRGCHRFRPPNLPPAEPATDRRIWTFLIAASSKSAVRLSDVFGPPPFVEVAKVMPKVPVFTQSDATRHAYAESGNQFIGRSMIPPFRNRVESKKARWNHRKHESQRVKAAASSIRHHSAGSAHANDSKQHSNAEFAFVDPTKVPLPVSDDSDEEDCSGNDRAKTPAWRKRKQPRQRCRTDEARDDRIVPARDRGNLIGEDSTDNWPQPQDVPLPPSSESESDTSLLRKQHRPERHLEAEKLGTGSGNLPTLRLPHEIPLPPSEEEIEDARRRPKQVTGKPKSTRHRITGVKLRQPQRQPRAAAPAPLIPGTIDALSFAPRLRPPIKTDEMVPSSVSVSPSQAAVHAPKTTTVLPPTAPPMPLSHRMQNAHLTARVWRRQKETMKGVGSGKAEWIPLATHHSSLAAGGGHPRSTHGQFQSQGQSSSQGQPQPPANPKQTAMTMGRVPVYDTTAASRGINAASDLRPSPSGPPPTTNPWAQQQQHLERQHQQDWSRENWLRSIPTGPRSMEQKERRKKVHNSLRQPQDQMQSESQIQKPSGSETKSEARKNRDCEMPLQTIDPSMILLPSSASSRANSPSPTPSAVASTQKSNPGLKAVSEAEPESEPEEDQRMDHRRTLLRFKEVRAKRREEHKARRRQWIEGWCREIKSRAWKEVFGAGGESKGGSALNVDDKGDNEDSLL